MHARRRSSSAVHFVAASFFCKPKHLQASIYSTCHAGGIPAVIPTEPRFKPPRATRWPAFSLRPDLIQCSRLQASSAEPVTRFQSPAPNFHPSPLLPQSFHAPAPLRSPTIQLLPIHSESTCSAEFPASRISASVHVRGNHPAHLPRPSSQQSPDLPFRISWRFPRVPSPATSSHPSLILLRSLIPCPCNLPASDPCRVCKPAVRVRRSRIPAKSQSSAFPDLSPHRRIIRIPATRACDPAIQGDFSASKALGSFRVNLSRIRNHPNPRSQASASESPASTASFQPTDLHRVRGRRAGRSLIYLSAGGRIMSAHSVKQSLNPSCGRKTEESASSILKEKKKRRKKQGMPCSSEKKRKKRGRG